MFRTATTFESAPQRWRCDGNTHFLACDQAIALCTWACSPNCLRLQFSTQATFPHKCPTCITMSDEAHVIQEIGHLRELRLTAEAVQADHDRHAQSEAIELIEEYISKREMELEHEVTDEVWSLYVHEGEEGIKRRHEERKLEAVRSRVETDIPEWLRDHAAEGNKYGECSRAHSTQTSHFTSNTASG